MYLKEAFSVMSIETLSTALASHVSKHLSVLLLMNANPGQPVDLATYSLLVLYQCICQSPNQLATGISLGHAEYVNVCDK